MRNEYLRVEGRLKRSTLYGVLFPPRGGREIETLYSVWVLFLPREGREIS